MPAVKPNGGGGGKKPPTKSVPAKAVKVTSTDGTRYVTPGAAAKRAAATRRLTGSAPSSSVPAKRTGGAKKK